MTPEEFMDFLAAKIDELFVIIYLSVALLFLALTGYGLLVVWFIKRYYR